jgi:hypothetical protein
MSKKTKQAEAVIKDLEVPPQKDVMGGTTIRDHRTQPTLEVRDHGTSSASH